MAAGANAEAQFNVPATGGKNRRSSELNGQSLPVQAVVGTMMHRHVQTRFLAGLAELIVHLDCQILIA